MNKRRYIIEASAETLARFTSVLADAKRSETFIHRVTPDVNEEYYYVVVSASENSHEALKAQRFTNSTAVQ